MMRFVRMVVASVALVLGVSMAKAEPEPEKKTVEVIPADVKPSGAKPAALSDEQLKDLLDRMGYEYKIDTGNGKVKQPNIYKVKLERDGWTYYVNVSLSMDAKMIWLSAPLKDLPPTEKVPAERLERIFAKTDEISPTFFSMNNKRRLYLSVAFENVNVTAVKLRTDLDTLLSQIKATQELWDSAKWASEAPKAETTKVEKKD